jgi:Plasmid maintenance system killer protein
MIKSFKHKGLRKFFITGDTSGIQPKHAGRLARILDRLEASESPQDMNAPGLGLHQLLGDLKTFWAVKVSGNWRVLFRFSDKDAHDVDYQDYH